MKFVLLIIIGLLSIAHSKESFIHDILLKSPPKSSYQNNMADFLTGFFNYFGITNVYQSTYCIDEKTPDFFDYNYKLWNLLNDIDQRNNFRIHWDLWRMRSYTQRFLPTISCIFLTQEFTDLLDTLDISKRNPKLFEYAIHLYFEARFTELLLNHKPVIDNLNKNDFKSAGIAFGKILDDLVTAVKDSGANLLAYQAISNGKAFELDIDLPADSIQCHNDESASLLLQFLYLLTRRVANSEGADANLVTLEFMEEKGKDLLDQIPESVWSCLYKSEDIRKISAALKIDIKSVLFWDLLTKYINDYKAPYHRLSQAFASDFEKFHLIHAGAVKGKFLEKVARTMK